MIELPEAITVARQMQETLVGKRIAVGNRGNSPHKFVFVNRPDEEYAAILPGLTITGAWAHGSSIIVDLDPGYRLVFGDGGERLCYHPDATTLPKKCQLLLQFEDGSYFTLTVSGWGSAKLLDNSEHELERHFGRPRISPTSDDFTLEYFNSLFAELRPESSCSAKYFIVSDPGILGVANGMLQDILFHARIHPRRAVVTLSSAERTALYHAIRDVISQAVAQQGRHDERDLFNQPGQYHRILDASTVNLPCVNCGTLIQKEQFLGGAIYFCPECQVRD
ncbi:MAG: DNA-formamidopyrimidine glycosylase family protein [bacterium]